MEKRRLLENLGFAGTAIESGKTVIEMEGRERFVIENHRGVVFMKDDLIKLRLEEGMVSISGADLKMDAFSANGAVVSGLIKSVEFD